MSGEIDIEKRRRQHLEELKKGGLTPEELEKRRKSLYAGKVLPPQELPVVKGSPEARINIDAYQKAYREYLFHPEKFPKKPELKDFVVGGREEKKMEEREVAELGEIYRKQIAESVETAITEGSITEGDVNKWLEKVKKQAETGKGGSIERK